MSNKTYKLVKCIDCGRFEEAPLSAKIKNFRCSTCREIHRKAKIKEYEEGLRKTNYWSGPFYCETCGKEFMEDWRTTPKTRKKSPPRFCCRECANSHIHSKETKEKIASSLIKNFLKENQIEFNEISNFEDLKDLSKRNGKKFKHKKEYKYPQDCVLGKFERCQAFKNKSETLKKLGFDFNKNWEDEFFRIRNNLYNLYYVEQLSFSQIREKYNINLNSYILSSYFKKFGLDKKRNPSEETRLRFLKGDMTINTPDESSFIHGWYYSDINQSNFYYRSNYELQLMKILDAHNIKYSCNAFKIKYFDSKLNVTRTGFPDFLLPDYKLVIETKGHIFYDEDNLNDRYKVIKDMGYKLIIIELNGSKFRIIKNYDESEEISSLLTSIGVLN